MEKRELVRKQQHEQTMETALRGCPVFCPQVEVSPLENAVSVVENKNQELRTLISQYQHKQLHGNINLLSMTLNGVIDAAVNGGVARYQEVRRKVCLRAC